ncbi:MAG: hypothetical protein KC416_06970, partial [Myxococcales bacterium]|nr:hypothetical protein [Myxococcales bacterium]
MLESPFLEVRMLQRVFTVPLFAALQRVTDLRFGHHIRPCTDSVVQLRRFAPTILASVVSLF